MNNPEAIVIGSGAGGASFAWAMANSGARVLILEAGPRYDPAKDFRLDRADWERDGFPDRVPSAGRQTYAPLQALEDRWDHLLSWNHLKQGTAKPQSRIFGGYHHVVGVGGSTLHYTGESHRLNPESLSMYSRFGVAADWPVDYQELEPYYLEAEKLVGVAGPLSHGARPRSAPYPLPAHSMSYASQVLGQGFRKQGLSWTENPVASLSRPYDGRPSCNYCGQCTRGCPRFDKGTADVTFIAKALATGNCSLLTAVQVLQLETGAADRVKAVVYADQQGVSHKLEADLFVVACGAVETPRLLLNSADGSSTGGLANESGLVGRNFMETLAFSSIGIHPDPLGSHRGLPSDAICWDYNAPDSIDGVAGGFRISPATIEMNVAGPINYARRIVGGWGVGHKQKMRRQFGRALALGAIGENLPDAGSFIDLDPEATDAFGMPRARIHSHLGEMELNRLSFMAAKTREILEAAGVVQIVETVSNYDHFSATHVFGTCRMGADPSTSVVDRDCRSHRWRNLMVVDASVFPSSGGGESPSLTIYANALRAADVLFKGR